MNKTTKNLLLSLKNSSTIKLNEFYCSYSKKNIKILKVLYIQGFIQSYIFSSKSNKIKILLRYTDNKPIFKHLKFISTSVNSKTITYKELVYLFNKRFVLFLFTNKGLITSYESKKYKIGGKSLFLC